MDEIIIYMSTASGSREIKYQQEAIFRFLDSNQILFKCKDITVKSFLKDEMREKVGNPKALPPQDYQAFFEAVEDKRALSFFREKRKFDS